MELIYEDIAHNKPIPAKTGSGTYLKAMITEAHKKGYRQGLLGAVQEGLDYSNPILEYSDMVHFNTPEIPFPIMGMSDKMPYRSSIYKDMTMEEISRREQEFTEKLRKALEEFRPDIILSHHLWLGTSIAATVAEDIPVFGICHGTDTRQLHRVSWLAEMEALACGLMVVTTDISGLRGYMEEKLSSSGLVQFVKLPRMINIDTPLQEDYNQFVFSLKKTLDKQINIYNHGYINIAPFKSEIKLI
ncbi:MAG: hypothetical protein ACQEP4_09850 [Bacillota bacterium]